MWDDLEAITLFALSLLSFRERAVLHGFCKNNFGVHVFVNCNDEEI